MPPKFSLQPVLDYRHNRVEALEVELSNLLASRQNAAMFLEKLRDYQQRIFQELHRQQDGEMDLLTVSHLHSNLRIVEERIQQQQKYLVELEQQVQAKRSEIVGAKQDEETLVTLKRKEVERYQAEQARAEGRVQDDIYISQAFRKITQAH